MLHASHESNILTTDDVFKKILYNMLQQKMTFIVQNGDQYRLTLMTQKYLVYELTFVFLCGNVCIRIDLYTSWSMYDLTVNHSNVYIKLLTKKYSFQNSTSSPITFSLSCCCQELSEIKNGLFFSLDIIFAVCINISLHLE